MTVSCFQVQHCKVMLKTKSCTLQFLTNNSPDLYALTVYIMLRKISCFYTAPRNINEFS